MSDNEKSTWKKRALDEVKKLSVTVAYIWVLLTGFTLYRMMILSEYQIHFTLKLGFALINALVFAKFMWLGEVFHAGRRASGKPLLHSAVWNAGVFSVILMVCHGAEEYAIRWWHARSTGIREANPETLREFVSMLILIFVVLIPFFLAKGLVEILGPAEVRKLLLSAGEKQSALHTTNS